MTEIPITAAKAHNLSRTNDVEVIRRASPKTEQSSNIKSDQIVQMNETAVKSIVNSG